jgi:hypothetical protein
MIDPTVAIAGLFVGFVVGLTGMGGGALMTPVLVLLFGIPPTVAVASDLAASLFMKPLGAVIHFKRGTVNRPLVAYLLIGSVPSAFLGAAFINSLAVSEAMNATMKTVLGVTLLVAALAIVGKTILRSLREGPPGSSQIPFAVKPLPTIAIGLFGGFVVGMTSVGSGSLIMVLLMLLYPRLSGSRLVGTDLAQAIPLVGAAALGHILFGHVHFGLTASLLVGSVPGVCIGALISARASDHVIRPVLVFTLLLSSLKLLGASNHLVAIFAFGVITAGAAWMLAARRAPREAAVAQVADSSSVS